MTTITALLLVALSQSQTMSTPTQPPTTASVEVMQCAQAQMVVDRLLEAADHRLELARQSNSAAEMRAAVDALQATLRDVRAQLAPCAQVKPPEDPHLGHKTAPAAPPPSTATPGSAPLPGSVDPHAGHTMSTPKPAPERTKPSPPAAKSMSSNPVVDPVCGKTVDPVAAPHATHDGRTYHFCSEDHRQLFQKDPSKYLPKRE